MNKRSKLAYSKLGYVKHNLINRPTQAELVFKRYLEELGILYRFQKGIITSRKRKAVRIVDFYISRVNIAFEIDGGYHDSVHQEIQDFERESEIDEKKRNVLFVRFTNNDVLQKPGAVKQTIKEVYNDRLWDYMNSKRVGEKAKQRYKFL